MKKIIFDCDTTHCPRHCHYEIELDDKQQKLFDSLNKEEQIIYVKRYGGFCLNGYEIEFQECGEITIINDN